MFSSASYTSSRGSSATAIKHRKVWVEYSPQRRTLLAAVLLLLHVKRRKVGVECSPQRRTLRDAVLMLLQLNTGK